MRRESASDGGSASCVGGSASSKGKCVEGGSASKEKVRRRYFEGGASKVKGGSRWWGKVRCGSRGSCVKG